MIEDMLPHKGKMCLIDEMLSWDKDKIICRSNSHLQADNPLIFKGKLSTIAGLEYVGQAIALHRFLQQNKSDRSPKEGALAALKNVEIHREYLDIDTALDIFASCVFTDGNKAFYEFELKSSAEILALGNMMVAEGV